MKGILIILLAVIMTTAGCTNKNAVPSGIIPPPEMEKLLWDMIQADKFSTLYIARDSSLNTKEETLELYERIFKLHNTTKEEFTKSYNYYVSRPDLTKVMFDSLSSMANRRRGDMYKVDEGADGEHVIENKPSIDKKQ